jgi:RNA polymerase sigma-70 factor (ECF subfamily)
LALELEDVFRAYWPLVVGYLTRRTGSREAGEDLAQEVFFKAARAWLGWRGGNPAAWLMAIARNALADEARRGRPLVLVDLDDLAVDTPADALEVADALARMPEQQARLLRLVYLDGLTHVEVAALTGSTTAAVKTAVWRARETFRQHWTEGERD